MTIFPENSKAHKIADIYRQLHIVIDKCCASTHDHKKLVSLSEARTRSFLLRWSLYKLQDIHERLSDSFATPREQHGIFESEIHLWHEYSIIYEWFYHASWKLIILARNIGITKADENLVSDIINLRNKTLVHPPDGQSTFWGLSNHSRDRIEGREANKEQHDALMKHAKELGQMLCSALPRVISENLPSRAAPT